MGVRSEMPEFVCHHHRKSYLLPRISRAQDSALLLFGLPPLALAPLSSSHVALYLFRPSPDPDSAAGLLCDNDIADSDSANSALDLVNSVAAAATSPEVTMDQR